MKEESSREEVEESTKGLPANSKQEVVPPA